MKTYSLLVSVLPDTTRQRNPVQLVDISKLEGGFEESHPTSRAQLRGSIQALHDAGASAVGVDIDLSPNGAGWLDRKNDPAFLDFCLQMSKEMPVYLGVYRTRNDAPEAWLGRKRYASFGVNLGAVPLNEKRETLARVQREWKSPKSREPLAGMGYALAK